MRIGETAITEKIESLNAHGSILLRRKTRIEVAPDVGDESGIVCLNRRFQGSIFNLVTYLGRKLADEFAYIRFQLAEQFGIGGGVSQHAVKFPQRILSAGERRRVEHGFRRDDNALDPCHGVTEPKCRGLRLGEKMFGRYQKMIMDFGTASQLDTAGEQPAIGTVVDRLLDSLPHVLQCLSIAVTAIDVDLEMCPADDIGVQRTEFDDFTILDRDEVRALGASFADMPSLKVSGENHMGILMENNPVMNVTERPIIVALGDEVIECAGCVVRMAAHAAHAGVENADVEDAIDRLRIRGGEIVGNIALPEALAMKRNAKFLKHECLGLTRGKHVDALGHAQAPGDLAFRIVVAVEDEGRDVRFREAAHLAGEE